MSNYIVTDTELIATANKIKDKLGDNSNIQWKNSKGFADSIDEIVTGGGEIYAAISVTYPVGSVCTTTNGTLTLTATNTSGQVVFGIPEPSNTPETWTVSCVDGDENDATTVDIEDYGQTEYVALRYLRVYGAKWSAITSTPLWSRTDDAAEFVDPVPYITGATNYSSPFDNIYPWKDMIRVTDIEAGEMVKIPKFWYKLTQIGHGGIQIQIANKPIDGYVTCPACMDRGDGKGERDYILVGRYHCAIDTYKSTTGVKPVSSRVKATYARDINTLGTGIYLLDFATRFTIWLLYLVEYANWDSQNAIISGNSDVYSLIDMGYTDSMPYHTGTAQPTTYYKGTQYRYIEGLWDNVFDMIDGCYYNDSKNLLLQINPSQFNNAVGGKNVGKPTSGYPSTFSVNTTNEAFPLFIPSSSSGSNSTYTCDEWNVRSSSFLYMGGYYRCPNPGSTGLFYVGATSTTYADQVGCRLMKLP